MGKEDMNLSEKTPVQLGMIIAVACLSLGVIVGCVWWAATAQAKLDALIASVNTLAGQVSSYNSEVVGIRHKVELMDKVGTTAMGQTKDDIDKLRERVLKLEKP